MGYVKQDGPAHSPVLIIDQNGHSDTQARAGGKTGEGGLKGEFPACWCWVHHCHRNDATDCKQEQRRGFGQPPTPQREGALETFLESSPARLSCLVSQYRSSLKAAIRPDVFDPRGVCPETGGELF